MNTALYTQGMAGVVLAAFAFLGLLQFFEAYYARRGWSSLGERIAAWAQRNAWVVLLLVVLLATFLGHFYLNPLPAEQVFSSP